MRTVQQFLRTLGLQIAQMDSVSIGVGRRHILEPWIIVANIPLSRAPCSGDGDFDLVLPRFVVAIAEVGVVLLHIESSLCG